MSRVVTLTLAQRRLLRAALKRLTRAELRTLFQTVRAHDDRTLLAALTPQQKKPKTPRRQNDPLVLEVDETLKPIMGRASEKAELLVGHLAKTHRRKFAFEIAGLASAVRHLRSANISDAEIGEGARSLMAQLARLHGRETVV